MQAAHIKARWCGAGCVQCTFSANIRDGELQGLSVDSISSAPGALLASAKPGSQWCLELVASDITRNASKCFENL